MTIVPGDEAGSATVKSVFVVAICHLSLSQKLLLSLDFPLTFSDLFLFIRKTLLLEPRNADYPHHNAHNYGPNSKESKLCGCVAPIESAVLQTFSRLLLGRHGRDSSPLQRLIQSMDLLEQIGDDLKFLFLLQVKLLNILVKFPDFRESYFDVFAFKGIQTLGQLDHSICVFSKLLLFIFTVWVGKCVDKKCW